MSHKIIVPVDLGYSGRIRMVRHTASGEVRQDTGWFNNLILDSGLDAIGFRPNDNASTWHWLMGAVVGSGNTPPSPGDGGLETFVAGTTTLAGTPTYPSTVKFSSPPSLVYTKLFRFGEGVAAGNLSEVGISIATALSTAELFSRALIVDGGGTPITITVLSDEFLDVYYELTVSMPPVDLTGTFSMNIKGTPTDFDYVIRPARVLITNGVYNWGVAHGSGLGYLPLPIIPNTDVGGIGTGASGVTNGTIGTVTGQPTGTGDYIDSATVSTYVAGDFYRDQTFKLSLSRGNLSGGIKSFMFNFGPGMYQMEIDPVVDKLATDIFEIVMRINFANAP